MKIELNIDPATLATAQQKGIRVVNGRAMVYTKAHVRQAEKTLRNAFRELRGDFFVPKPNAVRITVDYHFPHPKGTPKSVASRFSIMVERPDADNLTKGLVDAMSPKYEKSKKTKKLILVSKGYFDDDSQVFFGGVRKLRTPYEPKIIVWVDGVDCRTGVDITCSDKKEQPLTNP